MIRHLLRLGLATCFAVLLASEAEAQIAQATVPTCNESCHRALDIAGNWIGYSCRAGSGGTGGTACMTNGLECGVETCRPLIIASALDQTIAAQLPCGIERGAVGDPAMEEATLPAAQRPPGSAEGRV